ncbi:MULTISPECIES: ABC-three component system protein [Bacillus]|uniref:ABC-three component system protein n=1 Tax=Bacillus TaxID=1386 RepID=UPI00123BE3B9|nr:MULTISPECIES: ABC-three component system protein [Bacillus]KAA6474136.1 HNH endonuclease [Bacillus swezeyi]MCY8027261.1 HNH endonuclease [Bacillus sonorensis]MCY9262565.1 HNH endonuclease [Bacillus haynesii]MDR4956974.1 HNH endonuclease signature motif containing protein [Bacillus sonorensis]MEC1533975.1 HNH endonuclease signature motif containing protein [Bacillus haynesii]
MQPNRKKLTENQNAILLSEVENMCPLCAKSLMYEKNGRNQKLFEGAHIYPLNPSSEEIELLKKEERLHEDVNNLSNIIALCGDCHKKFDNPRTVEEYRKLLSIKKNILVKNLTRAKYHDYQIETEIKQVIKLLVEEEFNEAPTNILNLTALKLDQKANKTLNGITKRKIRNEITDYYLYIKQQFKQLDKQYPNSFDVIATQIKSFYLIISRSETSQEVIYEQLTEWLSKKTENSSLGACGIIISFFIQNCEVF